MTQYFEDRQEAGKDLAGALAGYLHQPDVLVLALPRGGVPVAAEVARALRAELDVLLVRKVCAPFHPELALAAIASGGARALNPEVIAASGISDAGLEELVAYEQAELHRRDRAYRGDRPPPRVAGRIVILVDDGIATGATMLAAIQAIRALGPAKVVVAVPVAPQATGALLFKHADEYVCLREPRDFQAVGWWYRQFPQLDDETVVSLLQQAWQRGHCAPAGPRHP